MHKAFLAVVLFMESAARIQAPADAPSYTISPGRIVAGTVAVAGAIGVARLISWAWADVARPLFDGFVVRALRRDRANFEQYLRGEIFEDDLNAAAIREAMSIEAHRVATACDDSLRSIRVDMAAQSKALEPIGRIADSMAGIARAVEGVERTIGDMREESGRLAGTLEAMQRAGGAWNGVNRREQGGGPG